jgi:hypothetical protein
VPQAWSPERGCSLWPRLSPLHHEVPLNGILVTETIREPLEVVRTATYLAPGFSGWPLTGKQQQFATWAAQYKG